jgi:hypothetical protein
MRCGVDLRGGTPNRHAIRVCPLEPETYCANIGPVSIKV